MRRAAAIAIALVVALMSCKSKEEKALAAVSEGRGRAQANDLDGADAAYLRALEHVPDYPLALQGRAKVALEKNDPERARDILSKCTKREPGCAELDASAAKTIRDRLAKGSLEGADGVKLVDLALVAEGSPCGLVFPLVLIETREKEGKPVPVSFVAEVKKRVDAETVVVDGNDILGGTRLARATGKTLSRATTCEEMKKAEVEMESSYANVASMTGVPDMGSSEKRVRVMRSYALRSILARVTKMPLPQDPDERSEEDVTQPVGDAGKSPSDGGRLPADAGKAR
jgi:hypothetical protein